MKKLILVFAVISLMIACTSCEDINPPAKTLSVTVKSTEYVVAEPKSATVEENSYLTIIYHVKSGYEVTGIYIFGQLVTVPNPNDTVYKIKVTDNYVITFTTQAVTHHYTVNATVKGTGGTITPATTTVIAGANVDLYIKPDNGNNIDTLYVNNVPVEVNVPIFLNGNTYSVKNVASDLNIHVVFRKYNWNITATFGEGGTITPSGITNVVERSDKDYSIASNPGYMIDKVVVDNNYQPTISTSDPTKLNYKFVNVCADRNINATFKKVMVWWYATEKPFDLDSISTLTNGVWYTAPVYGIAGKYQERIYFRTNGNVESYLDGKLVGLFNWNIDYSNSTPKLNWESSSTIEKINDKQLIAVGLLGDAKNIYGHH